MIQSIGEDPNRDGLKATPKRAATAFQYLTGGYREDARRVINDAIFPSDNDEMIIVKDIELYSLCEHHLLPFFGKCHVGYIPDKKVVGLSKLPRVVDAFARRLQMQERLTVQIAEAIQHHLEPMGVGVIMEATHLCMLMRGVEKQNSKAVTSSLLGVFRTDSRTREEFLKLINGVK